MSSRTDVDALSELPVDEFTERVRAAYQRVVESRCLWAQRHDWAWKQLTDDDRAELEALRSAQAIKEHRERLTQEIGQFIETRGRDHQSSSAAMAEAGDVADEHLIRAELVAVRAAARRVCHPLAALAN